MANKTNKSYTSRIKITKNGKLKTRAIGQNHFNARQTGQHRMGKKTPVSINISRKVLAKFIPHQ